MGLDEISRIQTAQWLRRVPQPVTTGLSRSAIFLVVKLKPDPIHRATIQSFCRDLAALLRTVGSRDTKGGSPV